MQQHESRPAAPKPRWSECLEAIRSVRIVIHWIPGAFRRASGLGPGSQRQRRCLFVRSQSAIVQRSLLLDLSFLGLLLLVIGIGRPARLGLR